MITSANKVRGVNLKITIGVSEFCPSTLYHVDIGVREQSSLHFPNKALLCLNMVCVVIAMRSEELRSKCDRPEPTLKNLEQVSVVQG